MESIITINPFDMAENGAVNLLVVRTLKFEGEVMKRENWRCVLSKGADLTVPLVTSFGELSWADYPAEAAYLTAKWGEN